VAAAAAAMRRGNITVNMNKDGNFFGGEREICLGTGSARCFVDEAPCLARMESDHKDMRGVACYVFGFRLTEWIEYFFFVVATSLCSKLLPSQIVILTLLRVK
jgi:hypothetical protein